MIADPVLQESNWRAVAQRGVEATPVVEHLNALEQVTSPPGGRKKAGQLIYEERLVTIRSRNPCNASR